MASKWEKGPKVETALGAAAHILAGGFLFERHKVQSPGWMQNRRLADLRMLCGRGDLFYAYRKPDVAQGSEP